MIFDISTFNLAAARFCPMAVSLKQFAAMQARLAPKNRVPKMAASEASAPGTPSGGLRHEVLLGLDPSLRGTGYGVIRSTRSGAAWIAQGTIHCPKTHERSRCLAMIHEHVRDVIRVHHPTVCVVEGLFYAQNHQTTLIMGEARGAALAAAAMEGLEIYEIAPRKMKLAIVGYGAAQKSAVAKMVQRLLGLAAPPEGDAADALGLALVFTREQNRFALSRPKRL